MKETKYAAEGSSSMSSNAGNVVVRFWNPKLPAHFNAGLVTVAVVSTMIVLQIRDSVRSGLFDDIKRMIHPLDPPEEVDMPQHWNYSSHEFLPIISDWDEQRLRWIEGDPNFKIQEGARPKVLMVTGSSPDEGELYILSHLLLRAGKNKQDYSQMHDMELFYNMVNPDPEFSDWWVKLPVVRMLMLRHPEVEWIWWLDADAVITDMAFQPPFAKLDQYNLVLHGVQDGLDHANLDLRNISTAAFMIRNCQWSLDLLGAWAYAGTDSKREEARDANVQEETEATRIVDIVPEDDRSSLVALLAHDQQKPAGQQTWVPKVKLVDEAEYSLYGNWTVVGPKLEELSLGTDHVVPFLTHFEGCLPNPSEVPDLSRQDSENFNVCVEQLQRAFDFAENQVYRELGLERNILGNSSEPFIWKDGAAEESTETGFKILPVVTDWDQKRKAYMESKPWTKKDHAVILSGSPPTPCLEKEGAHLLVRGLKNQIDYSRVHGIRIFYNMAVIHKNLTGWWSKLPALKLMMINSLDVEWIWWTDSDAVFTNMDFAIPFERYNANGYNLVMWGIEDDVFDLKKYNGINTGNMFMRNCQWSLDLLDRWASMANTTEDTLLKFLSNRPPGWPADDQSVLVYLLITEREKWASKIFFENASQKGVNIILSGEWMYWTGLFVDEYKMRADKRPLVTHFAGCHPCKDYFRSDLCLQRYDRALNFADNQVLENYGLRHERLNSSRITGDFPRNAQVWTHTDIERMVSKIPKELAASEGEVTTTNEEEKVGPKEEEEELTTTEEERAETTKEQQEVTSTEEERAETTKEQQEVTSTEDEKVDPSKEEKVVTTTKEEETLNPAKEQEEVTQPMEGETVEPTEDQEEVPTAKEEEMAATQEDVNVDPSNDQEVDPTREEGVDKTEEKADRLEESESGSETQEEMEAPGEVEVKANNKEQVDRPEEMEALKEEELETTEEVIEVTKVDIAQKPKARKSRRKVRRSEKHLRRS